MTGDPRRGRGRIRVDGFAAALGLIAVAGLGIRLAAMAATAAPPYLSDATYFRLQGLLLTRGHGFAEPFVFVSQHHAVPSAFHPPLYSVFLGGVSWIGFESVTAARVATCMLGSLTVVLVGLLGREVGDRRLGLIAAAIAAATPNLWVPDGALASEGLAALMVTVALLAAYRLARRPRVRTAIVLGAAIGLAALTRPETLLLSAIVVIPIVVRLSVPNRVRWGLLAVATLTTVVVVGPWFVRSLTVFDRPVLFSTNGQAVIGYANCPATFTGPSLGSWRSDCLIGTAQYAPVRTDKNPDEAELAVERGTQGARFLKAHVGAFVTKVVWARIGRTWSLFRPFGAADARANEAKTQFELIFGVAFLWASLILGAVGAVALRRARTARVWPLLAPGVVVTVVSVFAYGTPRFRVVAEPSLAVLAALGICELLRRWHARASTPVAVT